MGQQNKGKVTAVSNPYKLETPFIVSFSGGATSGFMLRKIIDAWGGKLPEESRVVFANTGLEHEKTLDFVHEVEKRWTPVTWVEYCPDKKYKVVNYETASRKGEPFSVLIEKKKYLPNPVARICTVNLKIRASAAYCVDQGFEYWENAIGLRYDEPHRVHRMKGDRAAESPICPMYHAQHSLDDVEAFWEEQEFKLGIPRWMGNCVGCYLKSRGRIEMVAEHEPEQLDWWAKEEEKIGQTFRKDRTFRGIQLQVLQQGRLFDDDGSSIPCNCTD
jgi:3'-phosphoadenosine 5'-phosphosulfate sulfotransferase (PAPS reductase)/FAD synthetase